MKRIQPISVPAGLSIALVLVLLLLTTGCTGKNTTTLEYDFQAGDTYTYDMTVDATGSVTGPGVPPDQETLPEGTQMSMRLSMAVEDVTDGVATVTHRYEILSTTVGGQEVPMPGETTQEFTVTMDETGEILGIEGLAGMMPPGMSSSALPFDPSQFAGQTNVIYPEDGPVEPGDTWSATSTYPLPGIGEEITATSEGTLTEIRDEEGRTLASLDFTVDIPLDVTIDLAELLEEMGLSEFMSAQTGGEEVTFTMTMSGSENLSGTATVDTATGMPTAFDATLLMDMTTEVTEAPELVVPPGERGPFTIDMTAHMTMDEVE